MPAPIDPLVSIERRIGILALVIGITGIGCVLASGARTADYVQRAFSAGLRLFPLRMVLWNAVYLCAPALILMAMGMRRRWPTRYTLLLAWALAVITLTMCSFALSTHQSLSMSLQNWPSPLIAISPFVNDLAFPCVLLCLLAVRSRDSRSRGFQLMHVSGGFDETDVQVAEASSGFTVRRLCQGIAWIGLCVGLFGLLRLIVMALISGTLIFDTRPGRFAVIAMFKLAAQFSYVLLIVAAIAMLIEHRKATRWMIGWCAVFLTTSIAAYLLGDLMYAYWVATKPTPEPQSWFEIGLLELHRNLLELAFPFAALIILTCRKPADHPVVGAVPSL